MPDGSGWRCQAAWVLLLLSVLNWGESGSPFALPPAQEQAGTILVTVIAFWLAVQANPTLSVARSPCLLLAFLLVAVSTVPGALGMASLNSLLMSVRFGLIVLTIALLSPILTRDPAAVLRTHLWAHGAIAACLLAGGILAPGLAFHPGTRRLVGLLPPMHPSQVGAVAAVTLGLASLALVVDRLSRRLGLLAIAVSMTVLIQSRSRTAVLGALLGLLVALTALAFRRRRARKLLAALVGLTAVAWLVAAPLFVSWFARGQSHAQLQGFSGRRSTWIAMLEERPSGLTEWLGIGLSDKRYKGKPIDGGWMAAYWEQGLLGVGIVAALVLVAAWQAIGNRDDLLRAAALFLVVFVTLSANSETGISNISLYFLSLLLAGLLAAARPSTAIQGTRHAHRRRPQPLPLGQPQWREPGGGP
jgi:O-antigen ligase